MKLKDYQEKAIESGRAGGILPPSLDALEGDEDKKIILKAITGSGKTVIASEYIERLLSEDISDRGNKNTVIFWFSKGNGGLHMQSAKKIKSYIKNPDIHIIPIEDSSDFAATQFFDRDVYVINWEKIGSSNNVLTELTERANLQQALKNTDVSNTNFVFIIDEYHLNTGTNAKAYNSMIDLFHPILILGMTATPGKSQLQDASLVKIKVSDVQSEHMVKKGICFDDKSKLTLPTNVESDELFLKLAMQRRDLLENQYRSEGSEVVPLLLIQFDDAKAGTDTDEQIKNTIDILHNELDDNEYAIWLDSTYCKKVGITRSSNDIIQNMDSNKVKVLIFKQSIATGWDCPRAQVLLKYRKESESESFDLQTLGRIFRVPEPEKNDWYKTDDLNYGYVYFTTTDYKLDSVFEQMLVDDGEDGAFDNFKTCTILPEFENEKQLIESKFKGNNQCVITNAPEDRAIVGEAKRLIDDLSFDTDIDDFATEETRRTAHMNIDDNMQMENDGSFTYHTTARMREREANKMLYEIMARKYSTIVCDSIKKKIKATLSGKGFKDQDDRNKIILKNRETIKGLISDLDNYKNNNITRHLGKENTDFTISSECKINNAVLSSKCIYGFKSPSLSKPELDFIDKLDSLPNVKCWFKNLDKGSEALCVAYKHESKNSTGKMVTNSAPTYPDFIVVFTDNTIGLYEIKDKNDDKDTVNEKALAICQRCTTLGIKGGLIKVDNSNHYVDISDFAELN